MVDSVDASRAGARLTVDLGAIRDNYRLLAGKTEGACAAVMKADAYGLGMEQVAPALALEGCKTFFTAHLEEGIRLRQLVPEDCAIYVLHGPPPGTAKDCFQYDLRPVLNDPGQIQEWHALARTLDRELPANTPGEIVVRPLRPDIMFMGYWGRPADTMKVMRNMWFHTGDIGKFDEDGFFYFVDRKKDYLRRRGENISSFEMESAFAAHPEIEEVAVHAVPSDKGEDDVKVTAILKPGSNLQPEALFHWAVDAVPYYALPRYIEFRESMPKNPQGRVLKYQLRDEGCTAGTWDLERTDIKVSKR